MTESKCELCGEPMPEGEEMFKFHGYSGPCPKPPLPGEPKPDQQEILRRISKHWAAGWDGNFSQKWKEDDAEAGFWLPIADAQAIVAALAELQLALQ